LSSDAFARLKIRQNAFAAGAPSLWELATSQSPLDRFAAGRRRERKEMKGGDESSGVARPEFKRRQIPRSSLPLLSHTFSPFPFLLPSLPLEVGTLNPARGSGERCKLPERCLGGAEIEFGAF